MTTRQVVQVASIAALYTVLTVGIAPLSFGPIQFRVSEILKIAVLFNPWMALGIGIGTFFANLTSPFVGPWELIFMPLTDIVGGVIAWGIYRALRERFAVIPCTVYALSTAAAVALMLWALGIGGFWFMLLTVGISELAILIGGIPLIMRLNPWLIQH